MRVLVTGSADGLGHAAADALLAAGHDVVVHVRNGDRLDAVGGLVDRGADVVIGDLAHLDQTRDVAEQANRLGRMDAVIHNAGVYTGPAIMPVNVVAPYALTMLMHRPDRLVYLSSGAHRSGRPQLTRAWTGPVSASPAPTPTASCSSRPSPSPWRGSGRRCSATPSTPAGFRRGWEARTLPTTCASDTSPRSGWPPAMIPTP